MPVLAPSVWGWGLLLQELLRCVGAALRAFAGV